MQPVPLPEHFFKDFWMLDVNWSAPKTWMKKWFLTGKFNLPC